jgi:hypothetical protein
VAALQRVLAVQGAALSDDGLRRAWDTGLGPHPDAAAADAPATVQTAHLLGYVSRPARTQPRPGLAAHIAAMRGMREDAVTWGAPPTSRSPKPARSPPPARRVERASPVAARVASRAMLSGRVASAERVLATPAEEPSEPVVEQTPLQRLRSWRSNPQVRVDCGCLCRLRLCSRTQRMRLTSQTWKTMAPRCCESVWRR